ncbi:hypothetical protein [Streptomyces sp. NPDC008317]|uniref:hypothetical protein n=1 Tax=Streptomyces sp. NPDC008317 TaxID=3364827 RepID=UPI0036EE1E5F
MEQRPTVADLVYPIALALGGVWLPQSGYVGVTELRHVATLTHVDGRQLHLSESWDDPGHMHVRGAFPATDYPFRKGERDSVRVAMDQDPAAIAALISDELIPRHRGVHERVKRHNRSGTKTRRDVKEAARDITEWLPGSRTRIEGTKAQISMNLEPGEVQVRIDGHVIDISVYDAPRVVVDTVLLAVSRFLPDLQTPADERGQPEEEHVSSS